MPPSFAPTPTLSLLNVTRRLPALLLLSLGLYASALEAAIPPSAIADERFHLGYLVVTHYEGVDSTGTSDSRAGIQLAIKDAYAQRLTLYFPAGTYLVSDTLECYDYQLWSSSKGRADNPNENRNLLVGENSGQRPVIKLAPNAARFGDPADPRPVICYRNFRALNSSATAPASPDNPLDAPENFDDMQANQFDEKLQGINFDLSGNRGAIGVVFPSAQNAALLDVSIDATGAFCGFYGLPGRNSITANIEVIGGDYGVLITKSGLSIPNLGGGAGVNIAGARFINQAVASFLMNDFVPTAMVGFHVEKSSAGPVSIIGHPSNFNGSSGALCLIEGTIRLTGDAAGELVFDNADGRNLYLRNIYVTGTDRLVKGGSQPETTATGDWKNIAEYAYNSQQDYGSSDVNSYPDYTKSINRFESRSLIAGVLSQTPEPASEIVSDLAESDVPTDLIQRHIWKSIPTFDDGQAYIDATQTPYNATPDDSGSDRTAIQAAIDDASAAGHGRVFLPKGEYLIDNTLSLHANTILTGAGAGVSEIRVHSSWRPTTGEPYMIETVDDPDGKTFLAFISMESPLSQPNNDTPVPEDRFGFIHWRVGRASTMLSIDLESDWVTYFSNNNPKKTIRFSGGGGGRHYAISPHLWADSHPDVRLVSIEGTAEPLAFYGLNLEITKNTGGTAQFADANLEITDSQNIRIYGIKREGESPTAIIRNSSNIAIYANGAMRNQPFNGATGYLEIRDNSHDILIAGTCPQSLYKDISGSTSFATLYDEVAQPAQFIPFPNMVSLYKRGSIDDTAMYSKSGPTGLSIWIEQHYGANHTFDPLANDDKDAYTDLLEYAFDLDPLQPDPSNLGLSLSKSSATSPFLATLRQNPIANDLRYTLQTGHDLETWSPLDPLETPPSSPTTQIPIPAPDPDLGPIFIRLQVELSNPL